MKENELMIGDFVKYNGCIAIVYSISSPIPRQDIRFNNKSVITLCMGGLIDATLDEIEPIPITEDILKANGFVCDGEDEEGNASYSLSLKEGAYEAKYYIWGYFTKQGFDIVFGANNQPCEMYLQYVHELQHAIKLCRMMNCLIISKYNQTHGK